jgi:predicted NBD/HSP70 family sugar kinase
MRTGRGSSAVSKPRSRVFGLAIDDKVQWATAYVDDDNEFEEGTFDNIRIEGSWRPNIDLQEELTLALTELQQERPEIFRDCVGVGVSTLGVVDRAKKRLVSIALKNWFPREDGFLADFRVLFHRLGVKCVIERDNTLSVQNDASAKALAEYYREREEVPKTLLYLMFDEGVNGGIIVGKDNLASQGHPELGHSRPVLHDLDRNFGGVCPVHGACYEGLASAARIRRSWGGARRPGEFNLADLPEGHEAWSIEAWYIAQLCLNGALFLGPPERILLAGSVIFGHRDDAEDDADLEDRVFGLLSPLIWAEFERLNGPYPQFEAVEKFIRRARIKPAYANVMGALALARKVALTDEDEPIEDTRGKVIPFPGPRRE